MVQFGRSLLVPSVQEMAKEPITTVPNRYVRLDQDPPFVSSSTVLPQAPVIDMGRLSSGGLIDTELERLHQACKEWGFFQLINHGLNASLVEKVKGEIQEFFNLPMEEKKQYWQQPGEVEGFGQAFVLSEEQKLDWSDMFGMTTLPTHLRKPHLFPKLPLPLRETLEVYSTELRSLALKLLYCMAKALRMDPNDITELFEEGRQSMRMNYYPPCPQPELVMGLNAHSDAAGLTILLQLNEMEGLQIKKDGKWVPIRPLPNAFVINIGDVLEIVTNGAYRSIEHRATVTSMKERLSIATFYGPKVDGEMGPAPSLITRETPPLFRRIGVIDFLKSIFARELNGKSHMDVVRIQNKEERVVGLEASRRGCRAMGIFGVSMRTGNVGGSSLPCLRSESKPKLNGLLRCLYLLLLGSLRLSYVWFQNGYRPDQVASDISQYLLPRLRDVDASFVTTSQIWEEGINLNRYL